MSADALTVDRFLDGRVTITQPAHGYRAGVDPVFLAAAVAARPGERVLDLGCGVGTASLCLAARVPDLQLYGIELQEDYAALARENAARNNANLSVYAADLRRMPASLKAAPFDHVMMNPPYFDPAARTSARDSGREAALSDSAPVTDWCDAALRRLRPRGRLTAIHVPDQLPELLAALATRAATTIHPLAPRTDRSAHRIILSAVKGRGSGTTLAAPTILHEGSTHVSDHSDYAAAAHAVLRDGAGWPWLD